ncbi:MAG: hypothetical protein M1834_009368 [Cirrosporium novae-zelandiae]|nr:MAG: hypothetical protein M1834_009368 [Cirrosporium novae-zelandiae]
MLLLFPILALSILPGALGVSLGDYQSITDFSTSCTAVYYSDIPNCSTSQFAKGVCTSKCIASLQTLTIELNTICRGSSADSDTLIAFFFRGKGVEKMCPNYNPSSSASAIASNTKTAKGETVTSSDSDKTASTSTAAATSASQTTSASASIASSVSTSSSTPTSTSVSTSTSASTASTLTTATKESSLDLASTPSTSPKTSTTTSTSTDGGGGFRVTAVDNGHATVITSKADQSDSSNADAFGGGGSPFEISSIGSRIEYQLWAIGLGITIGVLQIVWR